MRQLVELGLACLGVLLPYISGEFFSELLNGLDDAAQNAGRFLLVSTSHRRPEEFRAAMQAMAKRVDGLVVMASELDAAGAASVLTSEGPVVFINTSANGGSADVLNFDNFGGAYALTRHLLEMGHRRIALIKGAKNPDAAKKLIDWASSPAMQSLFAKHKINFVPAHPKVATEARLAEVLKPAKIFAIDDNYAGANRKRIVDRWIAEILP